jgi:serine/threonine-protein kinase HipA
LNIIEEEGAGEPWLIKFASNYDTIDCGAIEYVYSLLAERAHLPMSQTHLFDARLGPGYFGTKRFDRINSGRLHMQSASALLHAEYRIPALDYKDLLALTFALTHDVREVERMYRIAVFNVLAYNRDDHGRNFSFLMDRDGRWNTAPAYDLTFSHGPGGEQSTMVMGEGRNPTTEDLLALGRVASIPQPLVKHIIEETREALSHWTELASAYGVSRERIAEIAKKVEQ